MHLYFTRPTASWNINALEKFKIYGCSYYGIFNSKSCTILIIWQPSKIINLDKYLHWLSKVPWPALPHLKAPPQRGLKRWPSWAWPGCARTLLVLAQGCWRRLRSSPNLSTVQVNQVRYLGQFRTEMSRTTYQILQHFPVWWPYIKRNEIMFYCHNKFYVKVI